MPLLLAVVIAIDMKLTVEAFSQDQQCHAVHMEIVSAPGTFAQCNQKCCNNQQHYPDAEQGAHNLVGGRNVIGYHDGG